MKARFEFVEPFDLLYGILGRKFSCELEILEGTTGLIVLDESVDISGVTLKEITIECRYENHSLGQISSGECVDVNGTGEGVYVIGLVCPW